MGEESGISGLQEVVKRLGLDYQLTQALIVN